MNNGLVKKRKMTHVLNDKIRILLPLYQHCLIIYTNMKQKESYFEPSVANPQFGMQSITQESNSFTLQGPLNPNSISFEHSHRQNHIQGSCPSIDDKIYRQHLNDLLPIVRASPGFRLLDANSSHTSARILPNNFDELDSSVSQLQTTIQSSIQQAIGKSLRKVECYKDFLGKNAIFKVYRKLQNSSIQHQNCCIRVINRLRELDQSGQAKENCVEDLIQYEVQQEKQFLQSQINYIKTEIMKILHNAKEESLSFKLTPQFPRSKQGDCRLPVNINDESCYLKNQQQLGQEEYAHNAQYKVMKQQQTVDVCQIMNQKVSSSKIKESEHIVYKQIPLQDDQRILVSFNNMSASNDQRDNITEIQYQLTANIAVPQLEEPNITNETNYLSTETITSKQPPKGIQFVGPDILIVRNVRQKKYKEFFKYLQSVQHIRQVIIENCNLATNYYIDMIIAQNKAFEGVHIHCSFKFDPSYLDISNIKYLSFFPNYRFIRIIDKAIYFCNVKKIVMPKKILERIENFIERPIFRNMYICKNTHPPIPETVEELHFIRMDVDSSWTIRYETLFQIETPKILLVLTFTNIIFNYSSACFKTIYCNYRELHTIVFQNCQGYQNKGVKQLRYLRSDQLRNLQISGEGLDRKIILKPDAVYEIFRHRTLETLILINIQFVDMMRKPLNNSSGLKCISRLNFLTHLNLYSSLPVCNDLLEYIHKNSYKNMEMLNLGFSQLTPNAISYLCKFQKLESLCLDYTCFGDSQLLQITKKMAKLKHLSVQNLNGAPNGRQGQYYGLITPYFFQHLTSKITRYLNIYNCHTLREYRWGKFNHIECIRINKGLFSDEAIRIIRGKGTIFLIEQDDAQAELVSANNRILDNFVNISSEMSGCQKSINQTNPQERADFTSSQEGQLKTSYQMTYEKNTTSQNTEVRIDFNLLAVLTLPSQTNQESSLDMLQEEI